MYLYFYARTSIFQLRTFSSATSMNTNENEMFAFKISSNFKELFFYYHNINKTIGYRLYDFLFQTIGILCQHKVCHTLGYVVEEGSINAFILLKMKDITIGHTFTNSPKIKYEE